MKWGDRVPATRTTCRRCGCSARSASRSTPRRGSGTGKNIGGERCPVVDTWWQTETGAIMISPLPGRDHAEARAARRSRCPASAPTSSTTPASRSASPAAATSCSTRPWPSMLRGIWGDPERYRDTYWSPLRRPVLRRRRRQARRRRLLLAARPRRRHHARRRATTSRPPRSSRALVDHPAVAEAAVVGTTDDDHRPGDRRVRDPARRQRAERRRSSPSCATTSAKLIGPIAKPKTILFTEELPKTRSGKIMRRLLRNVAEDEALGDTTTLADPTRRRRHQGALPRRASRRGLSDATRAVPPRALDLARRAGRARPRRSSSTSTACSPTPPAASTTSRRRAATGTRSSRRAATTRSSRRCSVLLDLLDPDAPDRAAHRPARTGCTTSPRRGCAATRSAGTC